MLFLKIIPVPELTEKEHQQLEYSHFSSTKGNSVFGGKLHQDFHFSVSSFHQMNHRLPGLK